MFASDSAFRSQAFGLSDALFGGVAQGLAVIVDHLAHVADAARALGPGLAGDEHLDRTLGASFDGGADLALADTVTVADVQGGPLDNGVLVSNANAVASYLQLAGRDFQPPPLWRFVAHAASKAA